MSSLIQTVRTLKEHSTVKENRNNLELEKIDNSKNGKRKSTYKNYVKPSKKFSIDVSDTNNQNIINNKEIKNENNTNPKERVSQNLKTYSYDKNSSLGFRKGKTKYILNLLNDTSLKKYKQSCISFLKEDDLIKNLYEENGFEKTNFSYDNFLEKNFFSSKLFLFKLEIMLTSEDFAKKNAKDKFFKKEITNFLKRMKEDKEIIDKKNNLNKFFEGQFSFIKSFDFNQ